VGGAAVGTGIAAMASRSDSTSCDSEVMRTLVSSTRSRTTRMSLPVVSACSLASANVLRVTAVCSSMRTFTAFNASVSVASAFCSNWVCSCRIRMSAAICCSSRRCASAGAAGSARRPATRATRKAVTVMGHLLSAYLDR
jgi:hypothetical protein